MTALAIRRPVVAVMFLALALVAAAMAFPHLSALWNAFVAEGVSMQRELHRDLAAAMRAVQASEGAAFWSLTGLGFLYGVFHAIGPGHGKVVIATYLTTHESRLSRGIALSLLSSLVQGLTAILLVGGVALLAERSMRESQRLGIGLEVMSYGLVILIGLFLMLRGARRLVLTRRKQAVAHHGCAHSHGPSAADLEAPLSARQLSAMVVSIGMRPCSGAILVLVLAFAMQQLAAGVAAVVAMSIGTGLAISALAAFSVYARKGALRLAAMFETKDAVLASAVNVASLVGGLMIAAFGLALLQAALAVSRHPLL